jgi:hypothetical protein
VEIDGRWPWNAGGGAERRLREGVTAASALPATGLDRG